RQHIFGVAESIAERYGPFGSPGNPIVSFDVVNEAVDDFEGSPGGLRDSNWLEILGEEYVPLAFRLADEAFNDLFAAEGAERPVKLFINEYHSERPGKQGRYLALVERLLAEDVPIDGVGHQFHVDLSQPVSGL